MYLIQQFTVYGWEDVDTANSVEEKNYLLREYRIANPTIKVRAIRA